jgi:hypothetical protein
LRVFALALVLLAGAPVPVPLEPEIDSQNHEDDELPPSSFIPYTTHFAGKKIAGANCLQAEVGASVKASVDQAQRLALSKDPKRLQQAVVKLKQVLAADPRTGWAYLTLGSAYAKLGNGPEGAQAYETYLLSCRKSPNNDRVQRILVEYWQKTGGQTP